MPAPARPRERSFLHAVPGVPFAILGLVVAWATFGAFLGLGELPGPVSTFALRAAVLLFGGALASGFLAGALLVVREPTLLTESHPPDALLRLCASCGAVSPDDLPAPERCSSCGHRASASPWRHQSLGAGIPELLGGCWALGASCFAVFLVSGPLESAQPLYSGGTMVMAGAVLFPFALLALVRFLFAARTQWQARGLYLADLPGEGSSMLRAEARLDREGALSLARGRALAPPVRSGGEREPPRALVRERLPQGQSPATSTYREAESHGGYTVREEPFWVGAGAEVAVEESRRIADDAHAEQEADEEQHRSVAEDPGSARLVGPSGH